MKKGERFSQGRDRFQAFSIPCDDAAAARDLSERIIRENRLRKASHVSWAARSSLEGRIVESRDDGGESGAGNCILEVLRKRKCTGILVAVARWYGGHHLGSLRFRIYRRLTSEILD